jgi:hypothetical protein
MVEDGTYDAVVVDARGDGSDLVLDLAIAAGARRGDVVTVRAQGLEREALDVLGVPAVLRVEGGVPSVALEG